MTETKPTDYAAIIRTANVATPAPPDWLKPGKQVAAEELGIGEIISLLGKRLIVKFPGNSMPVQFTDWPFLVQSGKIHSSARCTNPNRNPTGCFSKSK